MRGQQQSPIGTHGTVAQSATSITPYNGSDPWLVTFLYSHDKGRFNAFMVPGILAIQNGILLSGPELSDGS